MRRRTLGSPVPAVSHVPRAHFDPKKGWFRRLERATSLMLSRKLWPYIPGIGVPYSMLLDRCFTLAVADIPVAGLAGAFDGTTLLFISDLHAGPFISARSVARVFAQLGTLSPDVVIHGGDLATSNLREIEDHRTAITALRGRLGTFGVYGNHDHYTGDAAGVGRFLESCGVRLIVNDAVALTRGDSRLGLAGVDDWNIGRPELDRAVARAREAAPQAPIVLVSHNPDAALDAADRGVALIVSGHTHGGQVRIPGRPVLVRMSRYFLDDGRYVHEQGQIVVSRGLGVSGIPLRLFCSPEACLLTLRSHP